MWLTYTFTYLILYGEIIDIVEIWIKDALGHASFFGKFVNEGAINLVEAFIHIN